ncbi:MAG: hypothetical protein R3F37_01825 [Candidatus Competibacteraceae bacterium]
MNLSRRQFTVGALLLPLGSLFGLSATGGEQRAADASTDTEFTQAYAKLQQQVIAFLEAAGYRRIPAQSMITGHAFNGGLRYDDSGVLANNPNGEMVSQGCARIDDIPLKDRRGVLPFSTYWCATAALTQIWAYPSKKPLIWLRQRWNFRCNGWRWSALPP